VEGLVLRVHNFKGSISKVVALDTILYSFLGDYLLSTASRPMNNDKSLAICVRQHFHNALGLKVSPNEPGVVKYDWGSMLAVFVMKLNYLSHASVLEECCAQMLLVGLQNELDAFVMGNLFLTATYYTILVLLIKSH
jgi:hypothetical protein